MNFFDRRKLKKLVKHQLIEARHVRHYHEDIVEPEKIARLIEAEKETAELLRQNELDALHVMSDELENRMHEVNIPKKQQKTREYVEIVVVAVSVAMAFRAYFIQPFKIPTGSMQPSLNGITADHEPPGFMDKPFINQLQRFTVGRNYVRVRARENGTLKQFIQCRYCGAIVTEADKACTICKQYAGLEEFRRPFPPGHPCRISHWENMWHIIKGDLPDETYVKVYYTGFLIKNQLNRPIGIEGEVYQINRDFKTYVKPGDDIKKGQILAEGCIMAGDHIFVDKMRYNFSKPKRGNVIVFKTDHISHLQIRTNTFYIKRCVGLPGETVAIEPPFIKIDGECNLALRPIRGLIEDLAQQTGLSTNRVAEAILRKTNNHVHFLPNEAKTFQEQMAEIRERMGIDEDEAVSLLIKRMIARRTTREDGYVGYRLESGSILNTPQKTIKLGQQYLPCGDNQDSSLDGRYFGGVRREDLIGPAWLVYWPFAAHWGRVE